MSAFTNASVNFQTQFLSEGKQCLMSTLHCGRHWAGRLRYMISFTPHNFSLRYWMLPHLKDEAIEAQRGLGICLRLHSLDMAELEFKSKCNLMWSK